MKVCTNRAISSKTKKITQNTIAKCKRLNYDDIVIVNVSVNVYTTQLFRRVNMNIKKLTSLGLTTLMAVSMLAGCGSSSSTPADEGTDEVTDVTLTVWTPQEDQGSGSWLEKQLDAFKAEHPEWNLTFVTGVCSEGDAGSQVTQDPEAAADVFMFANDQIPTLLDANALAEFGGSTLDAIKKANDAKIVSYVTKDGGVYGVPFTTNTWYMYYDKRVFSEDDIKSLDTMLEKGVVSYPLTNAWYFAAPYLANGCTMFGDSTDNDAGIQFTGDAAYAVTNYLVDLAANKNFKNDADGVGIAGLADGSVNAIFSGSWDYNNVVAALGEENTGIAIPPCITINGEEKQLLSFAGVKAIGVNPHSANMPAAVALAAFLGGTSAQQDHYDMRSIVPTDSGLSVANDPLVKAQNDTVAKASFPQPFVSGMGNFWTPAADFGNAIVNKKVTHDNAAEMTDATNELYNGSLVD